MTEPSYTSDHPPDNGQEPRAPDPTPPPGPAPSANGQNHHAHKFPGYSQRVTVGVPAGFPLTREHYEDLRKSGLSDEQISRCCFYSIVRNPKIIAELLGWEHPAKIGDCLAIVYFDAAGNFTGYIRLKPSRPRKDKSAMRNVKYESPVGMPNRAYFPPFTRSQLSLPTMPLLITEGEKKAAKADQEGFPCIGLVGVYGFQKRRKKDASGKGEGQRELIPDLAAIPWTGRTCIIVYDSDAAEKTEVLWAEFHLAETLSAAGAKVLVVRLPPGPVGEDGKPAKVGLDDYLVANGPDAFRELLGTAAPVERPPVPEKPPDARPTVILDVAEHKSIDEATAALAAGCDDLYQRGGELVRLVRTQPIAPTDSPLRIELLPTADLRTRITKCARVRKYVSGEYGPELTDCHPEKWLVDGVQNLGTWDDIRQIVGNTESPVILPDGSALQTPGYHAGSGLFYEPNGDFPPIPEKLTRAHAERALAALADVVCDFNFTDPAYRSVWIASILTMLARFAFDGPAPLFLFEASAPGTGKSLLVALVALIVLRRAIGVMPYDSNKPEEVGKSITSVALQSKRAVLLDNVVAIGDASLDAALTTTLWNGRILGRSEQPELPLNVVWFATGNNVALLGDVRRRLLPSRIKCDLEKPEERTGFKRSDLKAWIIEERPRLLTAGLTILAAYCQAGRPKQALPTFGSYEAWSALVRGALVWAGAPDPFLARKGLEDKADKLTVLRGFLKGWKELDNTGEGITASEALKKLKANPDQYHILREVLAERFQYDAGKEPGPKQLGKFLESCRGRVVGEVQFDSAQNRNGVNKWFVRSIGAPGAASADTPSEKTTEPPKAEAKETFSWEEFAEL